ncbi:serine/arginine repetitive matrix protein 1-like [Cynocephalus volans]|uniref:serine/arginine repetitive matrix protein 1-like n=1 Tax=Cynocephalus volans TaxID=110931 RepID=UPI002FCC3F6A
MSVFTETHAGTPTSTRSARARIRTRTECSRTSPSLRRWDGCERAARARLFDPRPRARLGAAGERAGPPRAVRPTASPNAAGSRRPPARPPARRSRPPSAHLLPCAGHSPSGPVCAWVRTSQGRPPRLRSSSPASRCPSIRPLRTSVPTHPRSGRQRKVPAPRPPPQCRCRMGPGRRPSSRHGPRQAKDGRPGAPATAAAECEQPDRVGPEQRRRLPSPDRLQGTEEGGQGRPPRASSGRGCSNQVSSSKQRAAIISHRISWHLDLGLPSFQNCETFCYL